jgi:hypothetical protein
MLILSRRSMRININTEGTMALDRGTFEYQACLLMLTAAGADSEFSQGELSSISESLNELFCILKKNENSLAYLQTVLEDITSMSEEQLSDKITIAVSSCKANLGKSDLEIMYKNMETVAGVDGFADAETEFLASVRKAWF